MLNKSQTSTEYIIILAVVLIISSIAITSFTGFTSIGSSSDELNSQKFWQTADIAINSIGFVGNIALENDTNISIVNNFPTVIRIDSINISKNSKDDTTIDFGLSSFTLNPGQEVSKEIDLNSNNPCYDKDSGDHYDVLIVFKITDIETQGIYYYNGASTRLKGTCADS